MARTPRSDKSGVRKGAWTPEEDKKLVDYVTRYGHWNWSLLPKFAGLARCGKSCRLRWLNYLRPDVKRGNFTQQEEETIVKLHQHLGPNRWSAIAAQMPGRTDNEIKNHWHAKLKKLPQHKSHSHTQESQVPNPKDKTPVEAIPSNIIGPVPATASATAATLFVDSSSVNTEDTTATVNEDAVLQNEFAFLDSHYTFPIPVTEDLWLEPYMLDIPCFPSQPECFSYCPVLDAQLWNHDL